MLKRQEGITFIGFIFVAAIALINGKDLIITKDASGRKVVLAEYEVVKPLAFNLSALMDFKASTEK